jgi:hypothetical protein
MDLYSLALSATVDGGTVFSVDISEVEVTQNIYKSEPAVILTDGLISEIWTSVSSVDVYSYGEFGTMKSVYGTEDIYFLVIHDIDIEWIAMQWDSDFTGDPELYDNGVIPMEKDDDIWIFGLTPETGVFGDAYSAGQGEFPYVIADEQNDLTWERILVNDSEGLPLYYAWEIQRKVSTDDFNTGRDVSFSDKTNFTLMAASNLHHGLETEITQIKFVLSDVAIEGNNTQSLISTSEIDFNRFTSRAFRNGLYAGILVFIGTVYPALLLLRRSID